MDDDRPELGRRGRVDFCRLRLRMEREQNEGESVDGRFHWSQPMGDGLQFIKDSIGAQRGKFVHV